MGLADGQNVGNISLVQHAGELLALWEGGSAHVIDPKTLKTEARKDWSPETKGLPFGAHPRMDQDGSMWNIGYFAVPCGTDSLSYFSQWSAFTNSCLASNRDTYDP